MVARITPASAHSARSAPAGITLAAARPDGAFDDLVNALPEPRQQSGADPQQPGDGKSSPRGAKPPALGPQLSADLPAPEIPAEHTKASGRAMNARLWMGPAKWPQPPEAQTHGAKDTSLSVAEPAVQYTAGIGEISAPAAADGAGRDAPVEGAASTAKPSHAAATTVATAARPGLDQPPVPESARKPDHVTQQDPHDAAQVAPPSVQPQSAAHVSPALPDVLHAPPAPQPAPAASEPAPLMAAHRPDSAQADSPAVQSPPPTFAPNLPAVAVAHSFTPQRVTIRLSPPELGSLQIRIDRPPDAPPKVEIRVEHAQTLNLLLHDQPRLHQALDQAGVPPEGRNVVLLLGHSGGGQTPAGEGRSGNSGRSGVARAAVSGASADQDDLGPAPAIWNSAGLNVIA